MRTDARLKKLERHPETVFRQELRRLQTQDAKPLFEVDAELKNADPDNWDVVLRRMTDAQFIRTLIDSELLPDEKERLEEALEELPGLTAEAWRNVELLLSTPPTSAQYAQMKQEIEQGLQRAGIRKMSDAEREGYEAI